MVAFPVSPFVSTLSTARITTRKQTAVRVNIQLAPMSGSSIPPTVGPMIPEIVSCKPPKVVAEGNSSLGYYFRDDCRPGRSGECQADPKQKDAGKNKVRIEDPE